MYNFLENNLPAEVVSLIIALNRELEHDKAIFRLGIDKDLSSMMIVPASTVWLHELGPIINISREYQNHLKRSFEEIGYKISFNNTATASAFWLAGERREG